MSGVYPESRLCSNCREIVIGPWVCIVPFTCKTCSIESHVIAHRSLAYGCFYIYSMNHQWANFTLGLENAFGTKTKQCQMSLFQTSRGYCCKAKHCSNTGPRPALSLFLLTSHQPNSKHTLNDACWWLESVHGNSTEGQFEDLQPLAWPPAVSIYTSHSESTHLTLSLCNLLEPRSNFCGRFGLVYTCRISLENSSKQ